MSQGPLNSHDAGTNVALDAWGVFLRELCQEMSPDLLAVPGFDPMAQEPMIRSFLETMARRSSESNVLRAIETAARRAVGRIEKESHS